MVWVGLLVAGKSNNNSIWPRHFKRTFRIAQTDFLSLCAFLAESHISFDTKAHILTAQIWLFTTRKPHIECAFTDDVQFATLTELPIGGEGLAAVNGGSVPVCGGVQRNRFVFTSRSNHVQLRVIPSVKTRFLLRFEGRLMTPIIDFSSSSSSSCCRYTVLQQCYVVNLHVAYIADCCVCNHLPVEIHRRANNLGPCSRLTALWQGRIYRGWGDGGDPS